MWLLAVWVVQKGVQKERLGIISALFMEYTWHYIYYLFAKRNTVKRTILYSSTDLNDEINN